jgi:hypothetical protein
MVNKEIGPEMTDIKFISREWVEIKEESSGARIVFRPIDFPIPPARGRRHLNLEADGVADAKDPGPTDKLIGKGGKWSLKDRRLHLEAPGWEGEYDVEDLQRRPAGSPEKVKPACFGPQRANNGYSRCGRQSAAGNSQITTKGRITNG